MDCFANIRKLFLINYCVLTFYNIVSRLEEELSFKYFSVKEVSRFSTAEYSAISVTVTENPTLHFLGWKWLCREQDMLLHSTTDPARSKASLGPGSDCFLCTLLGILLNKRNHKLKKIKLRKVNYKVDYISLAGRPFVAVVLVATYGDYSNIIIIPFHSQKCPSFGDELYGYPVHQWLTSLSLLTTWIPRFQASVKCISVGKKRNDNRLHFWRGWENLWNRNPSAQ